jgi:hypothetical protein
LQIQFNKLKPQIELEGGREREKHCINSVKDNEIFILEKLLRLAIGEKKSFDGKSLKSLFENMNEKNANSVAPGEQQEKVF